jgi:hypothetical protein
MVTSVVHATDLSDQAAGLFGMDIGPHQKNFRGQWFNIDHRCPLFLP